MTTTAATVLALVWLAAGSGPAEAHVLEGARLFRENRFAEALVEFRVAERLGAADARAYAAAALVKLDRPEDALELFEGPGGPAPGAHPLLDYYHALACYGARLYRCADALLAGVGERTGPRVAEQARQIRRDIAAAVPAEPPPDSVDWYLARAAERAAAGRPVLARAFAAEARALGAGRADRHGVAQAEAVLAKLPPSTDPAP
ncbi:MAG TPA: hypothetical protein VEB43_09435 [Anaeromyxobacter sp.]|nr:hypothetical protein [Anaeromyxobacter sp.]